MINDLRRAAAQRRAALDCDSATARRFDAAAHALEEAHAENAALLAALNQARMDRDEAQRKAADLAAIARAANEQIKRLLDRCDALEARCPGCGMVHRVDQTHTGD